MSVDIKPIQFEDPSIGMGHLLQNAMMMEKMGTAGQTRRENAMINRVARQANGDRAKIRSGLTSEGGYTALTGQEKAWLEQDELGAKTGKEKALGTKAGAEAMGEFYKSLRPAYEGVTDPKQLASRLSQVYSSPLAVAVFGSPEAARDAYDNEGIEVKAAVEAGTFEQLLNAKKLGAEKALENHFQMVEEKDAQRLVGTNKYGAPFSRITEAKYGPKPHSPGTTVNVGTGEKTISAFEKGLGENQIKEYSTARESAKGARTIVGSLDQMIDLIEGGNVITGMGAGVKTDLLRAGQQLGMTIDEGMLANTELLSKGLNENLLRSIGQFNNDGVRLTPMSNLDLETFMKASPQLQNSPKGTLMLLKHQRKLAQAAVRRANTLTKAYKSNPKTRDAMSSMSIEDESDIPDRAAPGGAGIPQSAIDHLRRNPNKNPNLGAEFERKFGLPPGSAKQYLNDGGTPNRGTPFPAGQ